jgi:hypothetical protein
MSNSKEQTFNPFLQGLDKGSINAWVAENIKTIQDAFNFQKKLSTTTFPTTTTEVSSVSSAMQQWVQETAKKLGTFLAKPWKEAYQKMGQRLLESHPELAISKLPKERIKQMMPQKVEATTREIGFTPLTEEARKAVEKEFISIEQERQIREHFNRLVQMGFFKNPEASFPIWQPLIKEAVVNPGGKMPSWEAFALWQNAVYNPAKNILEYAEKVAKAYTEAGTPLTVDNVLNIIYAEKFDKFYRMINQGGLPVQLPDLTLDNIKDPINKQMTIDWITRVYAGYKLLKTEPPNPIKILYHTLSKGTSVTSILEEGIYGIGQDIQRATGEATEIPVIETTSEPEAYTIQTQFLRK